MWKTDAVCNMHVFEHNITYSVDKRFRRFYLEWKKRHREKERIKQLWTYMFKSTRAMVSNVHSLHFRWTGWSSFLILLFLFLFICITFFSVSFVLGGVSIRYAADVCAICVFCYYYIITWWEYVTRSFRVVIARRETGFYVLVMIFTRKRLIVMQYAAQQRQSIMGKFYGNFCFGFGFASAQIISGIFTKWNHC